MMPRSPISVKPYAIIFALVLGAQAAWLLAAELIRSPMPFFPNDRDQIEYAIANRNTASAAAMVGWLRGDLWVDYAISSDTALLSNINANASNNDAQLITNRAIAHAPYDSRAWLLLATINAQSGWKDDKTLAQLKMSYYTSPNDIRLVPLRMQIATQSSAINDDELRGLVAHEMHAIILHKPDMKQSIVTAYRGASPAGQHFIEERLAEIDRNFLSELRATKHN